MYMWVVNGLDQDHNNVEHHMDDSKILFDCVCEDYDEILQSILNMSVVYCNTHKLSFRGFEIIAM